MAPRALTPAFRTTGRDVRTLTPQLYTQLRKHQKVCACVVIAGGAGSGGI
ncbi:hypothetical protein VTO73DRAFT_2778 [Trametes versicolor]